MSRRGRTRPTRRAIPRVLASAAVIWSVAFAGPQTLVAAASPSLPITCTPRPVPFERIVDRAPQVFLVTVATRRFSGGIPDRYTFVVREALRGELPEDVKLPTTITVEAPVVTSCGSVLDARVNSHLVIALAIPAFDGEPLLAVPWRLRPDGTLSGGFDDGPDRWADIQALRDALAGRPFATPGPTTAPVIANEDQGPPTASIGIVIGLIGGALAAVAVVMAGRRAARRPPGANPPA